MTWARRIGHGANRPFWRIDARAEGVGDDSRRSDPW